MRRLSLISLTALSLLVACSHDDELADLARQRGALDACKVEIVRPTPQTAVSMRSDADPLAAGTQLDLLVSVGAGCSEGPLSYGICGRDPNGLPVAPSVWQGQIPTRPGGMYGLRATVADTAGPQEVCVKRDDLSAVTIDRQCVDAEVLCSVDRTCRRDTDSDPLHCGAACTPCPGGDNGVAACVAGQCQLACDRGYRFEAGSCRARPGCVGLEAACSGSDCCASDLIGEAPGQPLRFIRGWDASNDATGLAEFQPASSSPVTVEPFYMDRYEVTVGRFRRFVADYERWRSAENPKPGRGAHPRAPSSGWRVEWGQDPTFRDLLLPASKAALIEQVTSAHCGSQTTWSDQPADREALPINCVSFFVAYMYCLWDADTVYSRLPSEAEWNAAAAGGGQQRAYPWSWPDPASLAIDDSRAKYGQNDRYPYAVGSFAAGRARWNTEDLAGNVYEWVRDTGRVAPVAPGTDLVVRGYDPYIDIDSDPIQLADDVLVSARHVLRGGSFKQTNCGSCDPRLSLRTAARTTLESFSTFNDVGFRCVRNYP